MLNQTSVTEFFLLGVTDIQVLQPVLFVVFLAIYIVNVAGNGAILMVVTSDPRLHSPMYFFLGNLACIDICFSTVSLPKMLENFLSTHKAISFLGCISQLHFFHSPVAWGLQVGGKERAIEEDEHGEVGGACGQGFLFPLC